MICPKWLVQTSAAGVVGIALVALPVWAASTANDRAPQPAIEHISTHYVDYSAQTNATDNARRSARIIYHTARQSAQKTDRGQVRTHLYYFETKKGPHCPVRLKIQPPGAVDEARSVIESSRDRADDEANSFESSW